MPLAIVDGDVAYCDVTLAAAKVKPVSYLSHLVDFEQVEVYRADGAHHSLVGVGGPEAQGDGQVSVDRPLGSVGGVAVAREAHGVDGTALVATARGNVHTALGSCHALGAVARVPLH